MYWKAFKIRKKHKKESFIPVKLNYEIDSSYSSTGHIISNKIFSKFDNAIMQLCSCENIFVWCSTSAPDFVSHFYQFIN